ncbi:FLYWCH zinc finger domain-containing protein [Phthorimaea operculella]|nr:FLYWCH zinc finger domain-containing protein [Phthorimaea operculella]
MKFNNFPHGTYGDLIPIFVESNKGNRLLMLEGHRYRQKRDSRIVGKDRVRWVCSRSERFKCTAKLVTTGQDRIERENKRAVLVLQGYTFRQTTSDTRYWHCAQKQKKRCSARLRFDLSGNLKLYHRSHNHQPDRQMLPRQYSPARPIATPNDASLTVDGYHYTILTQTGKGKKRKSFWRCAMADIVGCQATVVTTGDRMKIGLDPHNHTALSAVTGSCQVMVSSRGTRKIFLDGYSYNLHRTIGAKTRWRCRSGHDSCKAVVFAIEDDVVAQKGEHNHPPFNLY